jgi:MFS family permease
MAGVIWMTIVAGSRTTIFGRMLGFNDFHFGLMGALPFLATFGQLPAAIIVERSGLRKFQFIYFMTVSRALWLAVAAIPLILPIPSPWAVWTMLSILAVSWFLGSLATPAWWSWMGDLIPRRIRGRYFAVRSRICDAVRLPMVFMIAWILDRLTRGQLPGGSEPLYAADQPELLVGIVVCFVIAAVLGVTDILLFTRLREVLPTTPDRPREPAIQIDVPKPPQPSLGANVRYALVYGVKAVREVLLSPLGDHGFRRYVLYAATMTFAATVGGQFIWRNALENLGFDQVATDVVYLVIGPIVGIIMAKLWGNLIDRWGRRPVLFIGTALTCVSMIPTMLVSPYTPAPGVVLRAVNGLAGLVGSGPWLTPEMPVGAWLGVLASVIMGATGWGAIGLAQAGIWLGFSDSEGRSKYLAASQILISFGGVAGGLCGGLLAWKLDFLLDDPIVVGTFLWNNWHATFAASILLRCLALTLLIGMPDPGSKRIREIARTLGANVYNNVSTRLFYNWRVRGWQRDIRKAEKRKAKDDKRKQRQADRQDH